MYVGCSPLVGGVWWVLYLTVEGLLLLYPRVRDLAYLWVGFEHDIVLSIYLDLCYACLCVHVYVLHHGQGFT